MQIPDDPSFWFEIGTLGLDWISFHQIWLSLIMCPKSTPFAAVCHKVRFRQAPWGLASNEALFIPTPFSCQSYASKRHNTIHLRNTHLHAQHSMKESPHVATCIIDWRNEQAAANQQFERNTSNYIRPETDTLQPCHSWTENGSCCKFCESNHNKNCTFTNYKLGLWLWPKFPKQHCTQGNRIVKSCYMLSSLSWYFVGNSWLPCYATYVNQGLLFAMVRFLHSISSFQNTNLEKYTNLFEILC